MTRVTVWHDGACPLCQREIALMRRLGFREVGEGGPDEYRGERVPTVWYALERDDWVRLTP